MATSGGSGGKGKRVCVIDDHCMDDVQWWVRTNPRIASRVLDLMDHVVRDPFTGTGKPEPLKGLGPDTWSRRITAEHRLVYVVFNDRIVFLMARYHY